jgi:hypothetical protein
MVSQQCNSGDEMTWTQFAGGGTVARYVAASNQLAIDGYLAAPTPPLARVWLPLDGLQALPP